MAECLECGDEFTLDDGCEDDGMCHQCAHAIAEKAERYREALEKALGLIAANRLVLGEHMEPEYVARVEKQGREALAAGVGDG